MSPWGVESTVGKVQRFRVPSTKPPETPNLLVPLSTKDGVKINFSAVQHCSRYEIWRTAIPVLSMEELDELAKEHPDLYEALFGSPDDDNEDFINDYFGSLGGDLELHQSPLQSLPTSMQNPYGPDKPGSARSGSGSSQPASMQFASGASQPISTQFTSGASQPISTQFTSGSSQPVSTQFASGMADGFQITSMPLFSGLISQEQLMPVAAVAGTPQTSAVTSQIRTLNPVGKLKTISNFTIENVEKRLRSLSPTARLIAFNAILEKYGPLAVADYSQLSWEMSRRVKWEKVGELPAKYNTTETVDPATGLLKPLSFTDTTAHYGIYYLYTVQAWNDDDLGSTRPEPVIATPRRNRPFDPIDGLTGEIVDRIPKPVEYSENGICYA